MGGGGSNLIFVQRMQEECFSKVQSQSKYWVPEAKSRLFHFQMYQTVPNRGVQQGSSTGNLFRPIALQMILKPCLNLPGESMQKRFCMCAPTCVYTHVHVCEGEARGGERSGRRNVTDSSNSLMCQLLCRRSYDRM